MPLTNLLPELAEAIIGSLFVAAGLATLVAGLAAEPRRAMMAVWFGVFSTLYGVRLASKSDLFQLVTPWPEAAFAYADAFITYAILVPAGLFGESVTGPGSRRVVRRTWQLAVVYAAAAIVNDLARGRPYASMWLNAPVVVTSMTIYLSQIVRTARGSGCWPADIRAVAVAGAVFTAVALSETLLEGPAFGAAFDLEPLAMLVLTLTLGWFVLSRVGVQASDYAALARELQLAREIPRSLLPQKLPQVPGLHLTGIYLPMSAVAGDFYDVIERPDGRIVIIVADVSGHGVPAALVASMVKVAFAAESERYARPGELLGGINRALTGKFERAYVTACCVVIDPARQVMEYAAAGHRPAMLRRRTGEVERVGEGGVALTLLPLATYATADIPFERGDCLLLFTDGLLEAAPPGRDDDFFGDTELARVVAGASSSADTAQVVLSAHRRWIGADTALADDVTLVVVRRREGAE